MDQPTSNLRSVSQSDQQHSGAQELLQLVSFKIGNEEFGVDILRVQEIIRVQELTRVPNSPDFMDGVINLRGKVIPDHRPA
jgi:purine-binding chemotaxis protein CheW